MCVKLRIKNVYSASFWVLPTPHSHTKLRTDFHAKFVKRRGSAQGCAFSGLENKNLTFTSPYSRKTATLGTDIDGTESFWPKTALQWGMLHVNSLNRDCSPQKLYSDKQIGVANYKYVISEDP